MWSTSCICASHRSLIPQPVWLHVYMYSGNKPPTSTCWLARLLYRSCQCITRTTCTQTRASQPQTVTTVRVGRTAGCLAGRYLVATCWVHDGSEHSCSYMHSRHAHVHVHVATRICTCSSTRTSPTTQQDAVTSPSALSDVATASAHNHTLSNAAKLV